MKDTVRPAHRLRDVVDDVRYLIGKHFRDRQEYREIKLKGDLSVDYLAGHAEPIPPETANIYRHMIRH